jgi:hypothetical protein
MAAATKQYLPVLMVYINSVSQVELQQVTLNWDPKKVPVKTRRGLSGFTKGPGEVTVSFKSAVPMGGPEFDPIEAAASDDEYRVQLPYGTKSIISEGQFMEGSLEGAIEGIAELGFSFMGTFNKPK